MRVRPGHIVSLALLQTDQDASGVTGQVIDTMAWNEEHGFGGTDAWIYEADREDAAVRRR